jgi:hypothetical protein
MCGLVVGWCWSNSYSVLLSQRSLAFLTNIPLHISGLMAEHACMLDL